MKLSFTWESLLFGRVFWQYIHNVFNNSKQGFCDLLACVCVCVWMLGGTGGTPTLSIGWYSEIKARNIEDTRSTQASWWEMTELEMTELIYIILTFVGISNKLLAEICNNCWRQINKDGTECLGIHLTGMKEGGGNVHYPGYVTVYTGMNAVHPNLVQNLPVNLTHWKSDVTGTAANMW